MTPKQIKELADKANRLRAEYSKLYELGDTHKAIGLEREYLNLRRRVIDEISSEVSRKRAVPLAEVKRRVRERPKKPRYATGIDVLDRELVPAKEYNGYNVGGFTLGNLIQIVGARGSGKSSIMMKIHGNISRREPVLWVDFEMGEARVVEKIEDFPHDEENLLYYNASREIDDIIDEIKMQYASGCRNVVIDSAMKIRAGRLQGYERASFVSDRLSELTSTLEINIFVINQLSQNSEHEGRAAIKHGNDAEYDADFIFFVAKLPKKDTSGKPMKDEIGAPVTDDSRRFLVCAKNRQDDRLFKVQITKADIFGGGAARASPRHEEVVFEPGDDGTLFESITRQREELE
ncbi:hypothetical protein [Nitratifractor salsuginis]|uniref:Uncharacterized protein n=1 Tax=Nitratifractor salsuginis (strain DSM 16511 / JCM 12458 / E9I37-1) TaxID=749222 RepID=E6WYD6_NITSE|nr:hypothetical protein [Nitratifractor salsuginis]ADV46448.1 hypothetical protein Nitsa_1195 [Nitratifractor salsuginis DSM 16511]